MNMRNYCNIFYLFLLCTLSSCFNQDEEIIDTSVESNITYQIFPSYSDVEFHENGFHVLYEDSQSLHEQVVFNSYDYHGVLQDNNSVSYFHMGPHHILGEMNPNSSLIALIHSIAKVVEQDDGTLTVVYEAATLFTQLDSLGTKIWEDTICSREHFPKVVFNEGKDIILGGFRNYGLLIDVAANVTDTFIFEDTVLSYPLYCGDQYVFCTYLSDEENNNAKEKSTLIAFNKDGDTLWESSYSYQYEFMKSFVLNNRVFILGIEKGNSVIAELDILTGEVSKKSILEGVFSNKQVHIKSVDDKLLVMRTTLDKDNELPGYLYLDILSSDGKHLDLKQVGSKDIIKEILDARYLGDAMFLISALVEYNNEDYTVVFKSNLEDIHYVDSVDFDALSM